MSLARFSSLDNNFRDTFKRVWMHSSAYIRSQHIKKIPRKKEKPKNLDDDKVESFFVDRD